MGYSCKTVVQTLSVIRSWKGGGRLYIGLLWYLHWINLVIILNTFGWRCPLWMENSIICTSIPYYFPVFTKITSQIYRQLLARLSISYEKIFLILKILLYIFWTSLHRKFLLLSLKKDGTWQSFLIIKKNRYNVWSYTCISDKISAHSVRIYACG